MTPSNDTRPSGVGEALLALANWDVDILARLSSTDWLRPMDTGGTDSSDHSRVLAKWARKGLVERARRNTLANELGGSRGSYVYRLTEAGVAALRTRAQEQHP